MIDGTWMTYEAAAERLGGTPEAIRQRARRSGWRKTFGNDGKARILVPSDAESAPDRRRKSSEQTPEQVPEQQPDTGLETAAMRAHIETLAERLANADAQLEWQRREHLAERERLTVELERARARHKHDLDWHRAEIAGLQAEVRALSAKPEEAGALERLRCWLLGKRG